MMTDDGDGQRPAAVRHRQWRRLAQEVPDPPWWQEPIKKIHSLASGGYSGRHGLVENFVGLWTRFDPDQSLHKRLRGEIRRILAKGEESDSVGNRPPDGGAAGVVVLTRTDDLRRSVKRGGLFMFEIELKNTGPHRWSDRMLYRLGPAVNSALPFTPGLLPVPDTEAGEACRVLIPGRAQWLSGLAVVSYVMVFADCSPAIPGHLRCYVDTRRADGGPRETPTLPEAFTADRA